MWRIICLSSARSDFTRLSASFDVTKARDPFFFCNVVARLRKLHLFARFCRRKHHSKVSFAVEKNLLYSRKRTRAKAEFKVMMRTIKFRWVRWTKKGIRNAIARKFFNPRKMTGSGEWECYTSVLESRSFNSAVSWNHIFRINVIWMPIVLKARERE